LDDAEQRVRIFQTIELVAAAPRPTERQLHRIARDFFGGGIRRALVEDHHDVGVQVALYLHRTLGRQMHDVAVDRRAKRRALLRDLAHIGETKYLEPTRVRENGLFPVHEAMQAFVGFDDVHTRPQQQMKRIAEHDLRAARKQFLRRHRLHGAVCADGHERGRFDRAASKRESATAGALVGSEELKLHR
jgi:hypothetical protein